MPEIWSSLPLDIVAAIALKLETFEDFIRFSSVCWSWNRASSLIKHQWKATSPVPWLLLAENTNENPNCVRKLLNFSDNKYYQLTLPQTFGKRCWGSTCGWIAMFGYDFVVELFNPITKAQISFPSFEPTYNLLKHKNKYALSDYPKEEFIYCGLNKLIVINLSQHEFVIIVLYHMNKCLVFARHGDPTWTPIILKKKGKMFDAVVMGDYAFGLYEDGSIVHWDVKEFRSLEIIRPIEYLPTPSDPKIFEDYSLVGDKALYLVQSGCDLLMVQRFKQDSLDLSDTEYVEGEDYPYTTLGFKVFILDHKYKTWEEIQDLGNVTLFVGENYSTSVLVTLDKCLKHNHIYFTDDMADYWLCTPTVAGLDMGIYDLKCKEKWPLYDGDDIFPSRNPSIWFIPQF